MDFKSSQNRGLLTKPSGEMHPLERGRTEIEAKSVEAVNESSVCATCEMQAWGRQLGKMLRPVLLISFYEAFGNTHFLPDKASILFSTSQMANDH